MPAELNSTSRKTSAEPASEQGMVFLGTMVVLALVLAAITAGILVMGRQSAQSTYGLNNVNQARSAALIGIAALQQQAQYLYNPTGSTISTVNTGAYNPGAVASGLPVGTVASALIQLSNPFFTGNLQAAVIANTFSANPPIPADQWLVVHSTANSANAQANAMAVLDVTTPPSPKIENKITLSGKATLNGNQFGGSPIGVIAGSTVNGTTYTTTGGSDGSNPIVLVSSIPAVNPYGLEPYASIQLLDVNGTPTLVVPPSSPLSTTQNLLYATPAAPGFSNVPSTPKGVAPGSYTMACSGSGCSPANPLSLQAFTALGLSFATGGSNGNGQWTLAAPVNAFVYSTGDVQLNFSKSYSGANDYISIAADGGVTTGQSNGSVKYSLLPFAQMPDVCQVFPAVCQTVPGATGLQPNPGLLGLSIASGSGGITLSQQSTIDGSIGSNGLIQTSGSGSITINGALVANGNLSVATSTTLSVNGALKGSALSSPNNVANFGRQVIGLKSLFWE